MCNECKNKQQKCPTSFLLMCFEMLLKPKYVCVYVCICVLTLQSQTLTLMSCWNPTETMKLLLVENATHDTPYLWD